MDARLCIESMYATFKVFEEALYENKAFATSMLLTLFEIMYARMDPPIRALAKSGILAAIEKVGDEMFEDAEDFAEFMDKIEVPDDNQGKSG